MKRENPHNIVRLGIGLYGMWPSEHLEYLNKKEDKFKACIKVGYSRRSSKSCSS